MIPELGHFALIVAFVVAVLQAGVPLAASLRGQEEWMRLAPVAAGLQFFMVVLAFASLIAASLMDDFSVSTVAENSHTLKPVLYKIAGVWGNHEGSLVLWVLILTLFGALVAASRVPEALKARTLAVQAMISMGFLAFILFTSDPFGRIYPPPVNGNGLNPLLQDPGLAFHPPCLYLGYVGFSIVFSFAVAALWQGECGRAWAGYVRPWALAAWSALTLGIALGSWWAYYTLGWGGWWFWDPVENASLMPWLAGTALLHSLIVVEKRAALKSWTLLLAILTFGLSLLGTFLVRSGVLTSVHSFANDPERGIFVLALLAIAVGGALTLYALRASTLKLGGLFQPVSREGALVLNNLLLASAAATVLTGTLYPLFLDESQGHTVSVGPPYFNKTFIPLMVPLIVAMGIGPMLNWKRGDLAGAMQRLKFAAILTGIVVIAVLAAKGVKPVLAPLGMAMAAWCVFGALAEPLSLGKRLMTWPPENWGRVLAHAGLGIVIAGMTGSALWMSESITSVHPGDTLHVAGYDLKFAGAHGLAGPNYTAEQGIFEVSRNGHFIAGMRPERRFYPVQSRFTTQAAIRTDFAADLYVTLGEVDDRDHTAYVTRIYHHPLVPWIWIGAVIMTGGGLTSLSARVKAKRRLSYQRV
jgi:cytochrome c-type biogenesis protein CcmF